MKELTEAQQRQQERINDTFTTMAEVIARRTGTRASAIKEWLTKKGYTTKDFGMLCQWIKDDELGFINSVLWD